jgi:hypothetical protein
MVRIRNLNGNAERSHRSGLPTDSFAAIEPVYENDAGRILSFETEGKENFTASRIGKQGSNQETDLMMLLRKAFMSRLLFGAVDGTGKS